MGILDWAERWSHLIEAIGIISSLSFSAAAFRASRRDTRSHTRIEITKHHGDLWGYFADHPELKGLLDKARVLGTHPLTDEELEFANRLFIHVNMTWYAERKGTYSHPERFREDLVEVFSNPAILDAWSKMKRFHETEFVALIERAIATSS